MAVATCTDRALDVGRLSSRAVPTAVSSPGRILKVAEALMRSIYGYLDGHRGERPGTTRQPKLESRDEDTN